VVTGDTAALADYLGLSPSRITNSGSGWGSLVNGQREVFDASVNYLSGGERYPALVLSDNNALFSNRNNAVASTLGGYLSTGEQRTVNAQVTQQQPGDILNVSTSLSLSANRAYSNNSNALTGFAQDLNNNTSPTFLETVDKFTVGFAEHIGRNWETAFTDDKAPSFMRTDAALGVASDAVMLATMVPTSTGFSLLRGGVSGEAAGAAVADGTTFETSLLGDKKVTNFIKPEPLTGESDFYNSVVSAGKNVGADGGVKISNLGKVFGDYSAVEPGPLAENLAGTFAGGRYSIVTLKQDTILYRAGTEDQPMGQFFSLEQPISVIQTRIDKAVLPVWPGGGKSPLDTMFVIKIPEGTSVYIGEVGSQEGFYLGGTQQIVVPKPWTIDGVEVTESSTLK